MEAYLRSLQFKYINYMSCKYC